MAKALRKPAISVKPSGGSLGADIENVDLSSDLASEDLEAIKQAWYGNLVLRFRGQKLSDDQLKRFSENFGKLDCAPIAAVKAKVAGEDRFVEVQSRDRQYVTIISNVIENGKAIGGLGAYESVWHTDMSYNPEPPSASLLYALEIPPSGGDTGFANMYLAYETLSPDLRRQIEGKVCRHDASRNSAGELRRGFKDVTDPRETPGADHPLVRTHPITKRKALFLGRRRNAYIQGLAVEESERLLNALWAHASRPELSWYQKWRVGDLVMWDNRCTMHRRDAFDESSRRVMHRTQVKGDRPY